MIELNKMLAVETKLDAMMNKVSMQERRNQSTYLVGTVEDEQRVLNDEELANDGPYHMEEVQFVNGKRSYNFKPNTNLPTHYTPALRNHKNFSYGPVVQQGQRLMQNYQQQYGQHGFQGQQHQNNQRIDNQDPRRSQSFEEQMLSFMGENKRLLNIHEQKFAELAAF